MALKDWRKTTQESTKDYIEYEKKKDPNNYWIQITKRYKNWMVNINGKSRFFKTKSSALSYAKSYMRTH